MKKIFVDTSHLVAVINKRDQLHEKALETEREFASVLKVTSEFVLIETLNYFSKFHQVLKTYACDSIERFLNNPAYQIVLCSSDRFQQGYELYSNRLDKGFSLTDCTSMTIMREQGISEVLTSDGHFEQEGFQIFL